MLEYKTGYDSAIDAIMSGENCVIIGAAGSGKSLLIHTIMQFFETDTILCASSGIAARNIGGTTAHSTFRLPLGFDLTLPNMTRDKIKVLASRGLNRIIIDEAFMLRSDYLDLIDLRLKLIRKNQLPFGGLQMVIIGDPLQLGPVLQSKSREKTEFLKHYTTPLIFGSKIWDNFDFIMVEMNEVKRQENKEFSSVLSNIREGIDVRNSLAYINDNYLKSKSKDSLILGTTRNIVNDYNMTNFNSLIGNVLTYRTKIKGKVTDMGIEKEISLKAGCRVILTHNDQEGRFSNGSLGVVTQLFSDCVQVMLDQGGEVVVNFVEISCFEYKEDKEGKVRRVESGRISYMPLALGWAVTVHRSQGLTLSSLSVDLGWGAFCSGQTYTALSRAKSIDKLHMKRHLRESDIIVDKEAIEWIRNMRS